MRFTKEWTESVKSLGGSIWRPTLDVGVAVTTGWETHRFLVDSGADLSMAPYGLFRLLGKRWKDGQPRILRGISRRKVCTIRGRVHDVEILVAEVGLRFFIPMCFARANVPFLLGREGLFDYFVVTFDKPARKTHFELVV